MRIRYRVGMVVRHSVMVLAMVVGAFAPFGAIAHASGDSVDELHYSYGNDATSVVFDWHGQEQNIYYGPDTTYGSQAVADNSPITPVDIAGPFREVTLTGLQAGTTYHYKVGATGLDHTFATSPAGDYTSVDIGDSASSYCGPSYMPQIQSLIAAQNPDFVTHGGDISYANECGVPAVHSFYTDIETWSHDAAFQVSLGNHEYGQPSADAPAGTPADTLANYKGRDRMSNAQTTTSDTISQLSHPGCGAEIGSSTNTCRGDDWGYFTAGHVFYISYPEPDAGAYADWQTAADGLMAQAQANPNIDFIVSYGHRPAYTDTGTGVNTDLRAVLDGLAAKYSPAVGNLNGLNGKYIMNIQHHAHNFEAYAPKNGLTYVTDGAGGAGFASWATPLDPDSVYRLRHFGVMVTKYNATAHSMQVSFVCGSDYTTIKDTCTYGATMWSASFTAANGTTVPANPVLQTTVSGTPSTVQVGQQVTYTATAQNTAASSTATAATLGVTLPANMSVVSAAGATISGNTATWSLGDLAGGTAAVSKTVTAQLVSGNAGDTAAVTAALSTTDTACSNAGSVCAASVNTSVVAAPTTIQWVTNPSLETDLTGWTGLYNSNSKSSRVAGGYDGSYSLRSINNSSSTGINGFVSKPHWIDGTTGKVTTAGTTYTGSIWVKSDAAGQKVSLYLREMNAGGTTISSKTVTITAANTSWFNVTNAYTAVNSGDVLAVYISAANVAAGQGFNADLLSLTSPNGTVPPPADTTPPTTPTGLTATAASPTSVNLSWTTSSDDTAVTGYAIARNGTQIGTSTGTYYGDTAASAGTAYTYTVQAYDAAGNTSAAASVSVTTPVPLGTPTNLQATTVSSTEADLTWTAASGAANYTVQRSGIVIATVTGTTYADTTLTPGATYTYTVQAYDAAGNTSAASNAVIVTAPTVPTTRQWVTNQSLETDLTGWTGVYNANSKTTRVSGGYDGGYSLRSINNGTTTGTNGIVDKPHWIDGTAGKATVAGTTYNASVWVKPDAVGQKITLFVRELNSAGVAQNVAPYNVGVTITATSTAWVNITEAYPAAGAGDSLYFYLYATNSAAGQGFNADLFSLTSAN